MTPKTVGRRTKEAPPPPPRFCPECGADLTQHHSVRLRRISNVDHQAHLADGRVVKDSGRPFVRQRFVVYCKHCDTRLSDQEEFGRLTVAPRKG